MLIDAHIWEFCPEGVIGDLTPPSDIGFTRGTSERPGPGTRWRGIGYPVNYRSEGHWTVRYTTGLVKSSLFMLFSTPRGTRLMRPEFGSVLPELVFEPADAVLLAQIKSNLPEEIRTWEPRVSLNNIDVSMVNNQVSVTLTMTLKETGDEFTEYLLFIRGDGESIRLVEQGV